MRFLRLAVLMLLCTSVRWAFAQTPPPYKIYSTVKRKEITLKTLLTDLSGVRLVFFGEEHNDSVAHVLESYIWQSRAAQAGKNAVLSLEMFQTDVQPVLDEYLAGIISEKNFLADARPWPNYKDYRPLIEFARQSGNPVIAANAPSRYTNLVSRKGLGALNALSSASKQNIAPLPLDTLTGRYLQKFKEVMGGHTSMGGLNLYQAQNLWDATMASSLAKALAANPQIQIMHVCGRFHSDFKAGTVAFLQKYAPNIKPVTVSCFSTPHYGTPGWKEYEAQADYLILTPQVASSGN